jgi:hypothetical protein
MAQAAIRPIKNSDKNRLSVDAHLALFKADRDARVDQARLAEAYQDIESDIEELLNMARLLWGAVDHGIDQKADPKDNFFPVDEADANAIAFAAEHHLKMIEQFHRRYHDVFATARQGEKRQ